MPMTALESGAFAAIVGMASSWFNVLPHFLAGTTFYLYRNRIPLSGYWAAGALLAALAAGAFPPAGRVVYPFAATYLLFWFAFHPGVPLQNWSRHGDFSYGIYLYAFPIQQLLACYLPGISPVGLFVLAAPLSVAAGALSWHLVEKHFLSRVHRGSSRAQAPAIEIGNRPIESPLLDHPLSSLEG
jgi:peptidoglycan/LPS O-acetylase OafA/YrhL